MNEEKLSSDVVPRKFAEWVLAMGCLQEIVPSVDKTVPMCRGEYYMVWRSLMEHVQPKDVIRQKRLQVFINDVRRCRKKNVFNEHSTNVVVPDELSLWHEQVKWKNNVAEAEDRVAQAQQNLKQLMDKVSRRLSNRMLCRRRLQESQRRVWLLQQVAKELRSKRANCQEARSIVDSLCNTEEDANEQGNLDKWITLLHPQGTQSSDDTFLLPLSGVNPIASSSAVSTNTEHIDSEEYVSSGVRCRGEVLWRQLCERRAGLIALLTADARQTNDSPARNVGTTPQSVLAHTAALHCTLALETMKNRYYIKHTRKQLVEAISELDNCPNSDSCELFVLCCELAHLEARVSMLRTLDAELGAGGGVFAAGGGGAGERGRRHVTTNMITNVDKQIESKKDELKKLVSSLSITEKKIQNVIECLITGFKSFQKDCSLNKSDRYKGLRVDLSQESVASLRQFYEETRERRKSKMELSFDFDVSSCSFGDNIGNNNARFTDELLIYRKKFKLENNRKLVLESGDKIWAFETLSTSWARLYSRWQNEGVSCSLFCPSVSLLRKIQRLIEDVHVRNTMKAYAQYLDNYMGRLDFNIDISSRKAEEEKILDKIKKSLNENILSLQRTNKTLDLGLENLKIWSDNQIRKYISDTRTVDGKTYKEYEIFYLENLI